MNRPSRFLESLLPLFIVGIVATLAIGLFIMFSYILFWGLLIGSLFWAIAAVKKLFLYNRNNRAPTKTKGRIIEHHDQR